MAPMKRSRRALDDEEFEIVDVESAQSGLRQDSRKKPRTSYHDIEEHESDDEEDDDELEAEATQVLTQQRNRIREGNLPAENGILQSVTCTNFMCHSHLEVTLGALINFIIGHNGSGKSAVLTAITICLGGKATTTNRGQSLKSFIKEGEESAILSVKIKNTGMSAFQQDVYGDSIIVERHFSKSGGSTFKLKSATGKIISNRKGDLDEICDYYALQIDNPMNVLTQDMARQFLNSSTASDKYKFFMRGTQLEHLDGDYQQMEQSIDQLETELVTVDQDVEHYQKEAEAKKALLAISNKRDSLRAKIRNISYQMAWAQVEEQEQLLESYVGELREAEEAIAIAERRQNEAEEAFETHNHAHENANASVQAVENSITPLNEEKDHVKEAFDKCKKEAMEIQTQQRSIREELKAAEARIRTTKADIQEENRRLGDLDGGNHARRLAEIEEKKEKAVAARNHMQNHERSITTLEEDQRVAEKAYKESQAPVARKRTEVRESEERYNGLIRDRGQQQNAYPASMSRLLKAIDQEGGFRQVPVGPVGKHVRLKNPVWSSILEKSFGGVLNSFVVTSKEDQSRLSNLMQQVNYSCPIIIGNNTSINIRDHEPDPEFETWLRVLEIDNELVLRQLIIGQAIEQTILIKNRSEAVEKLNSGRLRNVKQCFSFSESHRGAGVRLNYSYGGNLAQNFIQPFNGVPRMKTDIEYQINSQRELIQGLKSELNDLERQMRERQTEVKKCGEAIVKHGKVTNDLRKAMQKAEDIVEKLRDALDRDAIEEGRLDALKQQLIEAEEEMRTHAGSFEESVIASDNAKDALRAKRDELSTIDVRIEEANTKLEKAKARAASMWNRRHEAVEQKNAAIDAVERAKNRYRRKENERDEKAAVVMDFLEKANEISPRVPVDPGETGSSLDKKLGKLEEDVKRFENQMGASQEKIAGDAAKAVQQAHQAEMQASSMRDLAQLLKVTLMSRRDRWHIFQRAITARARVLFGLLLSERRFRGKLVVDHRGKTLDLNVEPDATQLKSHGRKTKTLSGGEKSFSTTCLLLSLWEAMGSPLRCLDEFDVFMDSANREVSMDLMIGAARSSASRQFIFITPQAMSNVGDACDIKISKMTDPERGQRTLPFVSA